MTDATALEIGQRALTLAVALSAPILGFGLAVGLAVSVVQAATQIHEMTITFIPKVLAVALAVTLFGKWMLTQMVTFTADLLTNIPNLVR
ncbi:MAG TPA: flagellar biosynthesis protein FliQ [Armatimonadota bacterium]|nr:flagellar biosynthesis protein FliQ [Armatimonadota bacterium]